MLVEDAQMELSDTQVFVALVVALLPLAMAVRLGLALYQ
ncbi:MAG: photosystem I reaction center subunit XII [Gloeomargarita sp. DG02_4_bins_56]